MSAKYVLQCIKYQRILSSPLKEEGYIPENGCEVFVRNIPATDTEEDLLAFFGTAGEIFQIRLMMHENGIENRGFAYVTYFNSTDAKKAVNVLNKAEYKGKLYLKIENSVNNCRLFIGGIPTQKTRDQVWQELYKSGVMNIVDVIMYRSYTDKAENRGFVFVEFKTHEEAAHVRARYRKSLHLWGTPVIVDWSVPIPPIDDKVMDRVRVIYLRNLDVSDAPEVLKSFILQLTDKHQLEKVYKFKNYAFVHFKTREEAERVKAVLEDYYRDTLVEVAWAKPPNKYTTQEYRQRKVSDLSHRPGQTRSTLFNSKKFKSPNMQKLQDERHSPMINQEMQRPCTPQDYQPVYHLTSATTPTTSLLRPIMCSRVAASKMDLDEELNSNPCVSPFSPYGSPSSFCECGSSTSSISFDIFASPSHNFVQSSPLDSSETPSPSPRAIRASSSPIYVHISSEEAISCYQQNTLKIFRNNTNSSINFISYSDANIIPRNLKKEDLLMMHL